MKKHINIPIFIPHLGCPNQCVFCNQRSISGSLFFCEEHVKQSIEEILLATESLSIEREIAFFGGSFTGIDRGQMIRLLDLAQQYVDAGQVCGIRFSTRPDYISDEILTLLQRYTISAVELGIQSLSEKILLACKRGHSAKQSREAMRLLKEYGFSTVGQMMIGLPGSSLRDEKNCAKEICILGAEAVRVYPTVVFAETELAVLMQQGLYIPLTEEEAVFRCKEVLKIFDQHQMQILRVGLCESENLHNSDVYLAGPNHSAVGELAKSAVFYEKICKQLEEIPSLAGTELTIFSALGTASQVAGQKKQNKIRIQNKYNVKKIKLVELPTLKGYNIRIEIKSERGTSACI